MPQTSGYLVRDQGVGGSNPLSPTNSFNQIQTISGLPPHSGVGDFVAATTSKINNLRFKPASPICIDLEVAPLPQRVP